MNRDGAIVIAADKNLKSATETIDSLSGENQSIEVDVSSKQSIQNGMQQIISKYNAPPTIIVNAAGILKDNFLLKLDEEMFDDVIKVNLKVFSIESVFFFNF